MYFNPSPLFFFYLSKSSLLYLNILFLILRPDIYQKKLNYRRTESAGQFVWEHLCFIEKILGRILSKSKLKLEDHSIVLFEFLSLHKTFRFSLLFSSGDPIHIQVWHQLKSHPILHISIVLLDFLLTLFYCSLTFVKQ